VPPLSLFTFERTLFSFLPGRKTCLCCSCCSISRGSREHLVVRHLGRVHTGWACSFTSRAAGCSSVDGNGHPFCIMEWAAVERGRGRSLSSPASSCASSCTLGRCSDDGVTKEHSSLSCPGSQPGSSALVPEVLHWGQCLAGTAPSWCRRVFVVQWAFARNCFEHAERVLSPLRSLFPGAKIWGAKGWQPDDSYGVRVMVLARHPVVFPFSVVSTAETVLTSLLWDILDGVEPVDFDVMWCAPCGCQEDRVQALGGWVLSFLQFGGVLFGEEVFDDDLRD